MEDIHCSGSQSTPFTAFTDFIPQEGSWKSHGIYYSTASSVKGVLCNTAPVFLCEVRLHLESIQELKTSTGGRLATSHQFIWRVHMKPFHFYSTAGTTIAISLSSKAGLYWFVSYQPYHIIFLIVSRAHCLFASNTDRTGTGKSFWSK